MTEDELTDIIYAITRSPFLERYRHDLVKKIIELYESAKENVGND